jgi:fluoroacetyl-CoA thioesterase
MIQSKLTKEYEVKEENLANVVRSGSLPVLATPWVAAFLEETAAELAQAELAEGETTVGSKIKLAHLAPTLPGSKVTVTAELTEHSGRVFHFELEARDESGLIATATHERVAVRSEQFMRKAQARKDAKES